MIAKKERTIFKKTSIQASKQIPASKHPSIDPNLLCFLSFIPFLFFHTFSLFLDGYFDSDFPSIQSRFLENLTRKSLGKKEVNFSDHVEKLTSCFPKDFSDILISSDLVDFHTHNSFTFCELLQSDYLPQFGPASSCSACSTLLHETQTCVGAASSKARVEGGVKALVAGVQLVNSNRRAMSTRIKY